MGALAIANEDPTGISARILKYTLPNAAAHCAFAVQTDGTWTETPDYVSFFGPYYCNYSDNILRIVRSGKD